MRRQRPLQVQHTAASGPKPAIRQAHPPTTHRWMTPMEWQCATTRTMSRTSLAASFSL